MRKFVAAAAALTLAGLAAPAVAETSSASSPTTISIVSPIAPDATEAQAFVAELSAYPMDRKVDITYEYYESTAALIDLLAGSDPPDVVLAPQPGLVRDLATEFVDISQWIADTKLRRDFGDYLIDQATVDDAVVGVPIKADLKSMVWYEPAAFAAAGYEVPETFSELVALSDQMVADGRTPWCNYMEAGFATGWIGTDWIEDLLLVAEGPDVYDDWVDHDVLFADPRVEGAFERFSQMIDSPGYVFDRANVLNGFFWENALPFGTGDCMMHKQGSFFAAAITDFGFDLGRFSTFEFPYIDPGFADAAMGGGMYVSAVSDHHEVRQLIKFLAGRRFGSDAIAPSDTGWILPNERFDMNRYTNALTRSFAETVQAAISADQFRFDASDLMPPEVGLGTFWYGVTELVAGIKAVPQVLSDIDASWPS